MIAQPSSASRRLPSRQSSFVFEVTQACNHDCPHCHNAWKNPVDYPQGELATRLNLHTWRQTAELGVALGLDGLMFNRFNPGGRGREHIGRLQATPAELMAALDIAEQVASEYDIPVACSIAMPPCLIDHQCYPRLTFGFCAAGTDRAYYTLDPLGNVRPCNHSPRILGNLGERPFAEIINTATMREFAAAVPPGCSGCAVEQQCQGGCKAAGEACGGSVFAPDPFVAAFGGRPIHSD